MLRRSGRPSGTGKLSAEAYLRTVPTARFIAATQPVCQRLGRAVGQKVQHAAALQVHHDRAVRASLAQRPVIHDYDAWRLWFG